MSSLELQAELKRTTDRLPIVFITGHGDERMAADVLKAGAVGFLQKPFRLTDLSDKILDAIPLDFANRRTGPRHGM